MEKIEADALEIIEDRSSELKCQIAREGMIVKL
jgi:hypothetical protein